METSTLLQPHNLVNHISYFKGEWLVPPLAKYVLNLSSWRYLLLHSSAGITSGILQKIDSVRPHAKIIVFELHTWYSYQVHIWVVLYCKIQVMQENFAITFHPSLTSHIVRCLIMVQNVMHYIYNKFTCKIQVVYNLLISQFLPS